MKKLFSILLTVAMLLSAVAFPAVVSAEGETASLSFVVKKDGVLVGETNKVYRDDTITVDVVANTDFAASDAGFYFTFSLADLTYVSHDSDKITLKSNRFSYTNTTGLDVAENTVLGTITFKVNETAGVSTTLKFGAGAYCVFVPADDSTLEVIATTENATIDITQSSVTPKAFKNGAYENILTEGSSYFDASGVDVKVLIEGNGSAVLTKDEEVIATLEHDVPYTIKESGTYVITTTIFGGEGATYTFNFEKYNVDARLTIAAPSDAFYADGYTRGQSFVMPITISGLGENVKASTVTFSLSYDEEVLALTTLNTDKYSKSEEKVDEAYNILYNPNAKEEYNLADDDTVAELEFTVLDDAAFGTTNVVIDAKEMVLYSASTIITETSSIGEEVTTATATVVPEGAFATVSGDAVAPTNAKYDVTVEPEAGDVRVYYSEAQVSSSANELYGAANVTYADSKFEVSASGYYYVITKIGTNPAVYDMVEVVSAFDGDKPFITSTDATEWTSTVENGFEFEVTVNDVNAITTLEYKVSETEGFVEAEIDNVDNVYTITLPQGTSAETILVRATDAATNVSDETAVVVKVDADMPVAEVEAQDRDGHVIPLAITATDATSGVAKVEVLKDDVVVVEDLAPVEGAYSYDATEDGSYTVRVTDNAGNVTVSAPAVVTFSVATVRNIKVAINSDNETVLNGFTAGGVNNGTFMYVKFEKVGEDTVSGYTTTYTLEGPSEFDFEDGVMEISGVAGEYTLTTTTTNDSDEADKAVATYTFNIATTQEEMKSVNNDAIYNVYDYRRLVVATTGDTGIDATFTSGLLSADVNANMTIDAADAEEVLRALREDVEYVGIYTFAIMNGHKDEVVLD